MFEHNSLNNIRQSGHDHPVGGVSAPRHEIARHAYIQKKRRHLEEERALGLQTNTPRFLLDLWVFGRGVYASAVRKLHLAKGRGRIVSD